MEYNIKVWEGKEWCKVRLQKGSIVKIGYLRASNLSSEQASRHVRNHRFNGLPGYNKLVTEVRWWEGRAP